MNTGFTLLILRDEILGGVLVSCESVGGVSVNSDPVGGGTVVGIGSPLLRTMILQPRFRCVAHCIYRTCSLQFFILNVT